MSLFNCFFRGNCLQLNECFLKDAYLLSVCPMAAGEGTCPDVLRLVMGIMVPEDLA